MMQDSHALAKPDWAVISEREAGPLIGLSASHLRRLRRAGSAPQHVQLGERRIGYRLADLRAWLDARSAA